MDERLDYTSEAGLKTSSSLWNVAHDVTSTESVDKGPNKLYLQHNKYHLHIVHDKEAPIERPIIPASKQERLSFYRNYMASPNKPMLFFYMQMDNFNEFIWKFIVTMIYKTLPHTYACVFLASYTPHEHLYVPKMTPFFYGYKFSLVITSIFEIGIYVHSASNLFVYTLHGLLYKNPWNRCPDHYSYSLHSDTEKIACYELNKFIETMSNASFEIFEPFQLVQAKYYGFYNETNPKRIKIFFFTLIFVLAGIIDKCVNKKKIWKCLNIAQWSLIAFEGVLFLYLIINGYPQNGYELMDIIKINATQDIAYDKNFEVLLNSDIGMVGESMTAPPVVHVLTARSTDEIRPSEDSALIVISNAIQFIFRSLLTNKVKRYCEQKIKIHVKQKHLFNHVWFFYWTTFFSFIWSGDLYTIGYFALNLTNDLLTIFITYHCFLEVLVYEWTWLKRWMVTIFMIILGTFFYSLDSVNFESVMVFFIYNKGIVTFAEVLVSYALYPTDRLIDDVTFHCGSPPHKLKITGLRCMPFIYFIKLYIVIDALITMLRDKSSDNKFESVNGWTWWLTLIPYALGMVYIFYKYIVKDKARCQRMFIPDPTWGPQDYSLRQLRKEYDSRYYIGSQMKNRKLSRYMIQKSKTKAFQLDLNYNPATRSSMPASQFRMETEKKNL